MPVTSARGRNMPASPIRKLVPFAEEALRKGRVVYHLNIGQPDIHTPPEMMNGVRKMTMEVLAYTHSAGVESYRKGLANYYGKHGISVDHTEIIITTGGSEAIFFGLNSCLDVGDEIIVFEPFYANYGGFCQASGVKIVPIPCDIRDGFSLPPMSTIEKKIGPKTKGLLICNPSNPTGYLYSKEELLQIQDIVKKHDLFLFSDEVYREFCYDGKEHVSAMTLAEIDQNVVLIDSISKRYSACGARIGAIISKNKEVMNSALKIAQARLSPPTFGQVAAESALNLGNDYFNEVLREYDSRRKLVVKRLNEMKGVYCPMPAGAFYAMAELPIDDADVFCQWLLESFDFNNQTVMLAPGSGFYADGSHGKNQVRISYVLNCEGLSKAMDCLQAALLEYPGSLLREVKQEVVNNE